MVSILLIPLSINFSTSLNVPLTEVTIFCAEFNDSSISSVTVEDVRTSETLSSASPDLLMTFSIDFLQELNNYS